jgi:hypothetical protein
VKKPKQRGKRNRGITMDDNDEIPVTREYVDTLLKEIAMRDKTIAQRDSEFKTLNSAYASIKKSYDDVSSSYNKLVKEVKEDARGKQIEELKQRLAEITLTSHTYCDGAGALLRDADTRRKELRLIKARLETLTVSIESFLKEEKVIRGINEDEQDATEKRFKNVRMLTLEETENDPEE